MEFESEELRRAQSMVGQGRDPQRPPMTGLDLLQALGAVFGAWAVAYYAGDTVLDWLGGEWVKAVNVLLRSMRGGA